MSSGGYGVVHPYCDETGQEGEEEGAGERLVFAYEEAEGEVVVAAGVPTRIWKMVNRRRIRRILSS